MLALAYDAALRREELYALGVGDVDPAHRLLRIRAETTKGRGRERVVPYSAATGELYAAYVGERRTLSRERGPLFLSASRRNRGRPISIWTWSKVVAGIAARAGVPRFSTHTLRHLCLTDPARAGWDIHEIARFAGHRSLQTTLQYIHLSGRDLAAKLEHGMAEIHAWRVRQLVENPG
jgi:integrase